MHDFNRAQRKVFCGAWKKLEFYFIFKWKVFIFIFIIKIFFIIHHHHNPSIKNERKRKRGLINVVTSRQQKKNCPNLPNYWHQRILKRAIYSKIIITFIQNYIIAGESTFKFLKIYLLFGKARAGNLVLMTHWHLTIWPPGAEGRRAARQWKWRRRPTAEPEPRETQPLLDRVQLTPNRARKHEPEKKWDSTRRKEDRQESKKIKQQQGRRKKRDVLQQTCVRRRIVFRCWPFSAFLREKILQSTKLRHVRLPACVFLATRLQDPPVTHAVQCDGTSDTDYYSFWTVLMCELTFFFFFNLTHIILSCRHNQKTALTRSGDKTKTRIIIMIINK